MFPPTMLVPSLLSLLLLLGTASSEKLSGADALLGLMDIVFTRETCERTFCVPVQQCQDGFIDDSGCCPICRHILSTWVGTFQIAAGWETCQRYKWNGSTGSWKWFLSKLRHGDWMPTKNVRDQFMGLMKCDIFGLLLAGVAMKSWEQL